MPLPLRTVIVVARAGGGAGLAILAPGRAGEGFLRGAVPTTLGWLNADTACSIDVGEALSSSAPPTFRPESSLAGIVTWTTWPAGSVAANSAYSSTVVSLRPVFE